MRVRPVQAFVSSLLLAIAPLGILKLLTRNGNVPKPLVRLWTRINSLPIPQPILEEVRERLVEMNSFRVTIGVCAVIRSSDGSKYLFARHVYPLGERTEFWGLPGGTARKSDFEGELKREIFQELGIHVHVGHLLAVDRLHQKHHRLDHYYECFILGSSEFHPKDEVAEARFFALGDMPAGIYSRHLTVLTSIINSRQFAVPTSPVLTSTMLTSPVLTSMVPASDQGPEDNGGLPEQEQPQSDPHVSNSGNVTSIVPYLSDRKAATEPIDDGLLAMYRELLDEKESESKSRDEESIHFTLQNTYKLSDLLDPDPCPVCGSPMQKKLVKYSSRTHSVDIVCDTPMPAYHCTGCSIDLWRHDVLAAIFAAASRQIYVDYQGDRYSALASHFGQEATRLLEGSLPSGAERTA